MILAPGAAGIHPSPPVIHGKSLNSFIRHLVRPLPRAEALWESAEKRRLVADPATIIGALDFLVAVPDGAIFDRRVPMTYGAAIYLE